MCLLITSNVQKYNERKVIIVFQIKMVKYAKEPIQLTHLFNDNAIFFINDFLSSH